MVDTGAQRSALPEDIVHNVLKAKARGEVAVRTSAQTKKRDIISVRLETRTLGQTTSSCELQASVRKESVISHGVLGMDWISMIQPLFVYNSSPEAPLTVSNPLSSSCEFTSSTLEVSNVYENQARAVNIENVPLDIAPGSV